MFRQLYVKKRGEKSMNKITLTGRVVRDAEVRNYKEDKFVTKFSIANNDNKNPLFLDCVLWDKLVGELKKGLPVALEGRLEESSYKDKKKWIINVTKIVELERGVKNDAAR